MVDNDRGEPRPSLSEAATIDGARSIAVVDILARTTVWSVTFAPSETSVRPAAEDADGAGLVRTADEVLATVRAADLLAAPAGATGGWSEVVLIDGGHFHILRPLGAVSDALVVELVLDARSANLAAARQRFAGLVSTYAVPPVRRATPDPPDPHPDQPTGQPTAPSALPRRVATAPPGAVGPDPTRLVDEPILDRVAAALRALT